jgi:hypothetical protein
METNRTLIPADRVPSPRPARAVARVVMAMDIPNKHILDTSAWNALFEDKRRDDLVAVLQTKVILPTSVAITELAAIEDPEHRIAILQLVKTLGRDNRPLATPNELIIMACQGYSRHDAQITLNAGNDAEGAWVALNKPELVDDAAQLMALKFNAERESVFRAWHEGLRSNLQGIFRAGTTRPRSMGALIRHYAQNDELLYEAINSIYERAVGAPLPRNQLWDLIRSLPHWRLFLAGHACAIYQRAVKAQGYGHGNNPGTLDLWSATYLPSCDIFVTKDKRQRRALKILNRHNPRSARILSYAEWRDTIPMTA